MDSLPDFRIFSYSELKKATSKFSDANFCGQGRLGKVYRGQIGGMYVAVKLLSFSAELVADGIDLLREVDGLCKLNLKHPNLVPIIGACVEKYALVYQFVDGKDLGYYLFCKNLPWQVRIQIALEICSVLVYLRTQRHVMVIHGGLKPTNILLDAGLKSYVTDFGLIHLINRVDRRKVKTRGLLYNYWYKYSFLIETGSLEPMSDIYAFGMLLIRLLTNKDPNSFDILQGIKDAHRSNDLVDILDSIAQWPNHVAQELSELAIRCCELIDVKLRPDATDVFEKLKQMKEMYESSVPQSLQKREVRDINWDDVTTISFAELEQATSSFVHKLGEGGFGRVYKGNLWGTEVAIKLLNSPGDVRQVNAFRQEVNVLRKVSHPHLVPLLGACPEKCILVYQYMHGGTLEDRLLRSDLAWKDRIRIAIEICSALVFLHSPTPDIVVHGDLKPGNVLLDANGTSMLSDFGICRLIPFSKAASITHYTTTNIQGSEGYMDPFFKQGGRVAPSIDIYAFGMLLIRLVTNKKPEGHWLIVDVEDALEKNNLEGIVDDKGNWPDELAKELCKIALKCCHYRVKERPRLVDVCEKLKQIKSCFEMLQLPCEGRLHLVDVYKQLKQMKGPCAQLAFLLFLCSFLILIIHSHRLH